MSVLRRGRSRPTVLPVVAAVTVLGISGCGLSSSPEADSGGGDESGGTERLVVASWGGAFSEATAALAEGFTEETGIEVQIVDAPGQFVANLESQQRADNVEWDLLDSTSAPDAYVMYEEGLIQQMPADLKSELEGALSEGAVTDFGITWSTLGYLVACREDTVQTCPEDASGFFDTQAYPGSRTSIATSPMVNLSLAEIAAGVDPADIGTHEIDLDRAFATLESIKPSIAAWWQSGDQMNQMFTNGEAEMGIVYSGRAFALDTNGTPMQVVWDEGVYNPGFWNVVEGSANTEAAWQFVEWVATHPEAAAEWAQALGYSVPVPEAFDHMDEQTREQMADLPANRERLIDLNYDWYVENYDEVNDRWQEFLRG